jgi:hypothetical protein
VVGIPLGLGLLAALLLIYALGYSARTPSRTAPASRPTPPAGLTDCTCGPPLARPGSLEVLLVGLEGRAMKAFVYQKYGSPDTLRERNYREQPRRPDVWSGR